MKENTKSDVTLKKANMRRFIDCEENDSAAEEKDEPEVEIDGCKANPRFY